MSDYTFAQIDRNECIGNSLSTINTNFDTLNDAIQDVHNKLTELSASNAAKVSQIIPGEHIIVANPDPGIFEISYGGLTPTDLLSLARTAVVSAVNVGTTGARSFKRKSPDHYLEFRRIVPGGSNVSIVEDGDVIKISAFDRSLGAGGETNTTSNQGAGLGLALPKVGVNLPFKTLVAGNGIALSATSDTVQIKTSGAADGQNIGTGARVLQNVSNQFSTYRTLLSGSSNVKIQETDEDIRISVIEALSGTNTSIGAGIFKEKDFNTNALVFKGIVGTISPTAVNISPAEVNVSQSSNSVILTVNDKVSAANVTGASYIAPINGQAGRMFKNKEGNILNFKTLIPGNNIQITNNVNGNEVTISTLLDTSYLTGGERNIGANVGGATEVYKEKNGFELVFRTLSAGPGISLSQQTSTVTISAAAFPSLSQFVLSSVNLGAGVGLGDGITSSTMRLKTLSATAPYLTVVDNLSTKVVTLSVANIVRTAQNIVTAPVDAVNIFKEKQDDVLQFRKLRPGSGITLQQENDHIVVNATASLPVLLGDVTGVSFKNQIINGSFDIWQWQKRVYLDGSQAITTAYDTSITDTNNGLVMKYLADRVGFFAGTAASGPTIPSATFSKLAIPLSAIESVDALSGVKPSYGGRVTLGTRATVVGFPTTIGQRIENVKTLAGKIYTFSFYARSNNTGLSSVGVGYTQCYKASESPLSNAYLSSPSTIVQNVGLTTDWQRYVVTFTLPEISEVLWNSLWSGNDENSTWDSFTQIGIEINGSSGRFVDVTGLQLEEGNAATRFEKRPIAAELAMCQRYYEIGNRFQTQIATTGVNTTYNSFKTNKRKVPTMSTTSGLLLRNGVSLTPQINISNHVYGTVDTDGFMTDFSADANLANTKPYIYNWAANAEF